MSRANNSSTIADSNSSSNSDLNEIKQSVIKRFFIDVQVKAPKSWHGKCSICSQDVTDKYGTTSNFGRHMKTKHENIYEEWLAKKNAKTDNKQQNLDG